MGGFAARERLNDFAAARTLTLASIAPLSQPQLDFSPRSGSWSIGEVVDHLLRVERLYRSEIAELAALARAGRTPYRKHSFSEVNVAPLYLPDAVLSWLSVPFGVLSRVIPDRVRGIMTELPIVPTRHPDVAAPTPRRGAADLKADLSSSLAATRTLIESSGDLDLDALVSEHPLTGRTNVAQMMTFLARHESRHQGQMERVRVDPRFPPR